MDADGTLAAEDTGALFWKEVSQPQSLSGRSPLETLFDSPLGYSYSAFRQATLLYEQSANDAEFARVCAKVASQVSIHQEFLSLLQQVAKHDNVRAVVVTCGLRLVWEKILEKAGLSNSVNVIGGGRIADGFVVTPDVKGALVTHLQDALGKYVWAFGDSRLDLDMLSKANHAIVVVGDEATRSKSMESALLDAIDNKGLRAKQVLLPRTASPRLDTTKLPLLQLSSNYFLASLFRPSQRKPQFLHATHTPAANLLMTPTRNANISGPALREAHRRVGWYLAIHFLSHIIGLDEYTIFDVHGKETSGYRLSDEQQTLITPLMCGGESMAFGISDAFPLASFVHAVKPEDIKIVHLEEISTVVVVDSVINTGKSVVEFVQHVRALHKTVRIVIVAGVVQAEVVSVGAFADLLAEDQNISVVALRTSENKFKGTGGTDTGNRLFNTAHLP